MTRQFRGDGLYEVTHGDEMTSERYIKYVVVCRVAIDETRIVSLNMTGGILGL